jgi:hypothetical protein
MTLTFGIRSWEGTLLRATPTPSGGARLEVWASNTWKPCGLFGKYMQSDDATLEELAAAGLLEVYIEQSGSEPKVGAPLRLC